jgi:hypothetical protein
MKRMFLLLATLIITSMVVITVAGAQSQNQALGDYARAVKKTKNPPATSSTAKTVYDNDNMPKTTSISVVGDASQSSSDDNKEAKIADDQDKGNNPDDQDKTKNPDEAAKQDDKSADKSAKKDDPKLKAGQSAEERQKALDAWKDKLSGQQDKISLLSRELDVLQREHQLKAAEFYADTARRTQNPNGFAEEDAKSKQQIADKQKQLDDAKSKLTSLQDEARKAGAPNSITQ